ncbi:MAG: flagellar basal body-associated FliL family protein [Gammaproteobacteria bacterium]
MASRYTVLDDGEAAVQPPKKDQTGILKWLLIIFGLFLLVGMSVGASIYVMKSIMGSSADTSTAKAGGAKEAQEKHREPRVAIYYKFDPPFVVNIQGESGSRFLQLTLEAMTYDQDVTNAIDQSMPVIRNNVLLLLSDLKYEQISTLEGKQKLRKDILQEIQKVLKDKIGKAGVEEVYLTSLVMQ